MDRIDIINGIIRKYNLKNYLEIGVYKGDCFLNIKCNNKLGVDPKFEIPQNKKYGHVLFDRKNYKNHYYEMLSDDFFNSKKKHNPPLNIDICFIDGLHTFKQTIQDVLNVFKFMQSEGYVLLHDCSPPNFASASELETFENGSISKIEGWTGEWCGDVWKTIIYLKNVFPELKIGVINCDYGVGIINYKTNRDFKNEISEELFQEIKKMTYHDLDKNRKELLNLIDPAEIEAFLK